MNVLFVSSEANPFVASGGLADVLGALPKSIMSVNEDINCQVILPLYTKKMKKADIEKLEKVTDISFRLSWRSTGATVYRTVCSGVTYYFVENHYYFDRDSLYGEYDDAERFAFFSMAVVEFVKNYGPLPDILHANDWQTALSVIYLKTIYKNDSTLNKIRTVYTIHNIEYQGKFDPFILGDVFSLPKECYEIVEFNGCINLMKGAIVVSDYITTVSPHYAEELRCDFFAFGLQDIIASASDKMCGVINGIDYDYFSPDKGGDIDFPFIKRAVKSGKAKNKLALCRELGLSTDPSVPLVVMITRLASQKGIDLVLHVAEELFSLDMQFVLLGTGEKEYEDAFVSLAERFNNVRFLKRFDRVISKKMYASADLFLMPSKSEPCGLAQMICCSYGTLPIVRAVGGLYDSILPYNVEGANGFRFNNYNAHEMLYCVKDALSVYKNQDEWARIRKNAINSDFSWLNSAKKYIQIYDILTN